MIVVIGAFADLLGWDLKAWFESLWDTLTTISLGYIVAGVLFKTLQTTAVAFAYYSILRAAYPAGRFRWREVLAAYAASVGLNMILPANLGSLMLLLMLTTIVPGTTFAAILAVYGVQKIFFVVIGAFPYLYLFLTVGGSFDLQFGFVKAHPWGTALLLVGGGLLILLVVRMLRPRVTKWVEQAKEGGEILRRPSAYFLRVVLPEGISWVAGLCVIAVFLAAYDIPVTFDTLMRVVAGNSIANVTAVTPGGAGVNQAFNVASLNGVTSAQNATAYSVAQQLITTAWDLIYAIALMAWAFGWSGGKKLVGDAYVGAKEKEAERKANRARTRAAATER